MDKQAPRSAPDESKASSINTAEVASYGLLGRYRNHVLALIVAAGVGHQIYEKHWGENAPGARELRSQPQTIEVQGIKFLFSAKFIDECKKKGIWDIQNITAIFEREMAAVKEFMDVPIFAQAIKVEYNDNFADVPLQIRFNQEEYDENGRWALEDIFAENQINLRPDALDTPSVRHEMAHLFQAESKTMVAHEGFYEGWAEYIELPSGPDSNLILVKMIDTFGDDLANFPLQDEDPFFRMMKGEADERELVGYTPLKHELYRRAWQRIFGDTDTAKAFMKEFQRRQKDLEKKYLTEAEAIGLMREINPELAYRYDKEACFKSEGGNKSLVRGIYNDGILDILTIQRSLVPDDNPNHPKVYRYTPVPGEVTIFIEGTSLGKVKFTINFEPNGLMQKLDVASVIKSAGGNPDHISSIRIKAPGEKELVSVVMEETAEIVDKGVLEFGSGIYPAEKATIKHAYNEYRSKVSAHPGGVKIVKRSNIAGSRRVGDALVVTPESTFGRTISIDFDMLKRLPNSEKYLHYIVTHALSHTLNRGEIVSLPENLNIRSNDGKEYYYTHSIGLTLVSERGNLNVAEEAMCEIVAQITDPEGYIESSPRYAKVRDFVLIKMREVKPGISDHEIVNVLTSTALNNDIYGFFSLVLGPNHNHAEINKFLIELIAEYGG